MAKDATIQELQDALEYNPISGNLVWKARPISHFVGSHISPRKLAAYTNGKFAGKSALNSKDPCGRLSGRIFNKSIRAHVAAFAIYYGRWPEGEIDHINGDASDNRISNLREVSHLENMLNRKLPSNNKSGVMGVAFEKQTGKWRSLITKNGKRRSLGRFATFEAAVRARKDAEAELNFHPNHGRSK